jgi:RNA polymerase sigma-70 factor (ECF subfamily)
MALAPPDAHDDSAEDGVLARRVTDGDPAAEAVLCRRLLPRALAWGRKHVRDHAGAQDLAQQATITLLEALRAGRVDHPERVGAFFLGVCRRTLLGWRSGERARQDLLLKFGPALAGTSEIPPTAIDRVRLKGCFDRLAPRARTVVALSFYAERTADEIAAELGTSAGNVRVLRHRALEHLLGCMEGSA